MASQGMKLTRRTLAGVALGAMLVASGTPARAADAPPLPSAALTINIIDVGGALALTQKGFEDYRKAHPEHVTKFNYTKAPAPELAGKIKAQQDANHLDIDIVLTGLDGLAAGIDQNLWTKLDPDYGSKLPNLDANYLPAALDMHKLGQGYGVTVVYYPSGPLIEYAPERVKDVPTSAEGLLAWAKAHPNRFMYARPANSGPGRVFMMGLPYILGDKDPSDPVNGWDKTWAYLKELHKYVEYYPGGTGAVMKEFGEGTRHMTVTTTGWDINPRVLGTVPKETKVAKLDGFHWVCDGHYLSIPRGIADAKLAVVLDLIAFLLTPEQQAYTYDQGYFYPGPAVKNVTLAMAPAASQQAIAEFGRPEYADWIANNPIELPLEPEPLVAAFHRWNEDIASIAK